MGQPERLGQNVTVLDFRTFLFQNLPFLFPPRGQGNEKYQVAMDHLPWGVPCLEENCL